MRRPLFLCLLFMLMQIYAQAAIIKGTITDSSGTPIAYSSVYIKDRSYGVSADAEGTYFLELPAGNFTVVYSALGFEKHSENIKLQNGQTLTINVKLKPTSLNLEDVVISGVYIDRGKEIMRNVRKKGADYYDAVENYKCNTYQKISVEKIKTADTSTKEEEPEKKKAKKKKEKPEKKKKKKPKKKPTAAERGEKELAKLQNMNLIESVEEISYEKANKHKVDVKAYHDFSDVRQPARDNSVYLGFEYGEPDISAVSHESENPYLIYFKPGTTDFNFYRSIISAPLICGKPLLSPLAPTAELSYRFSLDTSFYDNGKKIYKVLVDPIFKSEALFRGVIFVEDSTWAVQSVDFSINADALLFCKEFFINQDYAEIEPGIYLPVRREFTYSIKEGKQLYKGNTRVDHSNYIVNTSFPPKHFNNAVKVYDVNAFNRDTTWWEEKRTITLKTHELNYIKRSDSVRQYLQSETFLDSADAEYNELDIWNFLLTGVGHRDRKTKTEFYFSPLIGQMNFLGIGGYRHMLDAEFKKEFANNFIFETNGRIDYGFANKDVRGKAGVGLTYVPLKFIRTYVEAGDYYDVINTYPSLGTLFSRANYVRTRTFNIAQRMEIVNGLFGELTFDYAMQDPISNMQQDRWSTVVYGENNEPTDFQPYKKAEVRLELKYKPWQKYVIKGNKKLIIGSKYPELSFMYRKGINGLFNSEVNFDYLQAGIRQDLQLGTFGYGSWSALTGMFINKRSLRVIEYKYFRGSDEYFFSSPLSSFQLLGPTLSASESYFRVNGIYHDQGYIFNKIPGVSKLRLGLAAGGGYLAIPAQNNFHHGEMFAGIEWIFRIKKQLFRLGAYGVTADNTISLPGLTWKVGLTFYDDYRRKWEY